MPDLSDFDAGKIDAAVSKKYSISVMVGDEDPEKPTAAKDSHDELKQSEKANVIISSSADSQGRSNSAAESGIEPVDVQGALKLNNSKELCKYYKRSFCRYGDLCRFQHSGFTSSNTVDVSISAGTLLENGEDESPRAGYQNDQNSPNYESPTELLEALCIDTDEEEEEEEDLEDDSAEDDVPTCYCCYHS